MEIAGHKLFLPANFSFLRRLPSRFDISVLSRGAEKSGLIAFELEVQGQRIVLKSGVELKVGARYELEKINETQFRIVRLLAEAEQVPETSPPALKASHSPDFREAFPLLSGQAGLLPQDLLAIHLLEEEGQGITRHGAKYFFDWDTRFSLSGVFVPLPGRGYTLFLAGKASNPDVTAEFTGLLHDLNIMNIRHVSRQALESIAAGAVDLRS